MKCWEELVSNNQNTTCSICKGEVQGFQRVYGVDLGRGKDDDGGSDEGTKGLLEKASCYVKRCGKFVNLSKGDWEKPSFVKRVLGVWLTILDLVIFIHFGWAIFSLASWGFATFNLASNTNWNTVIPSPQTLLTAEMYFCTFNLLALLIISWM